MIGQQTIDRANEIVKSGTVAEAQDFIRQMYKSWKPNGRNFTTAGESGWRSTKDVQYQTGQIYGQLKRFIESKGGR